MADRSAQLRTTDEQQPDQRLGRQGTLWSSGYEGPSLVRLDNGQYRIYIDKYTNGGIEVVDVPAKLARRVRMLSTGHGRKTDEADALSVGIAALTATRLNTAVIDEAIAALRALTEHRDDLVRARTQTTNRLHALLATLAASAAGVAIAVPAAASIATTPVTRISAHRRSYFPVSKRTASRRRRTQAG